MFEDKAVLLRRFSCIQLRARDYSSFEKVEIQSGVCTKDANGNWTITLKLKNSGTETATLISICINGVEIDCYNTIATAGEWTSDISNSFTLTSGQTATVKIFVSSYHPPWTLSAGTTINVKIHSAGGMDYIKLVELV